MKPELITRQGMASSAAARWRHQYPLGWKGSRFGRGPDHEGIYQKLLALGPTPHPDDVDRVIGNKSWTSVATCSACNREDARAVVMVGQEPDYDSHTAWLCFECIKEAASLLPTADGT